MSLEQILREFPFVARCLPIHPPPELNQVVRVSIMSLDVFGLPMGQDGSTPKVEVRRYICLIDERGEHLFPSASEEKHKAEVEGDVTIGDVLLSVFNQRDTEEWARRVYYLLYVVEHSGLQWHGFGRLKHFEAVVYKTHKDSVRRGEGIWPLIQRYRDKRWDLPA